MSILEGVLFVIYTMFCGLTLLMGYVCIKSAIISNYSKATFFLFVFILMFYIFFMT